jgi:peptidoglycan/xylan/chitin deacetylase (PgdA/CDA1 family)
MASGSTNRGDTLVLGYHAISEAWPAALSVTPDSFERQLALLVKRGYRGVTFSEALDGADGDRVVAITFDDAYESVVQRALPALSKLGLVATVFVPTAYPDRREPMAWQGIRHWLEGPHRSELMPASWEDLGRLSEAGWEIGSHTHTHPRLSEVPDDELMAELIGSKEECERHLRKPCRSLAYPYGEFDDRVSAAAARAGYNYAAALPGRITTHSPMAWPRIGIYHADTSPRFRQKISPFVRRLRASPLWALAERRHRHRT